MENIDLSVEQKIALLGGKDFWSTVDFSDLSIPSITLTDGPHGVRKQAGKTDHLGLSESLPATCFPPAVTLASTWNPELLFRIGEALGRECREKDVQVLLGPGINIKRSPLCGRNFEYFSEDPFLTGELAESLVAGVQSQGVGTSLKHFAVNSQETDRLQVSAEVDERTLREIYLKAFEQVVTKAKPWTVMCSYNSVNGVPASQNEWLLTEVLRNDWGFEGVVVSDWGAVIDRVAALRAGLDLEMPNSNGISSDELREALSTGALNEKILDRSVARIKELVQHSSSQQGSVSVDFRDHNGLAEEAAAQGMVLLKNSGGVLPLKNLDFVLVGELARSSRFQGAGSSQVNPTFLSSILDELAGDNVVFEPGYRLDGGDDEKLLSNAVDRARGQDVVLVLGLPEGYESEGFDRKDLNLPNNQLVLMSALREVANSIVVVLENGSAVDIASWRDNADAILETWLGGQACGSATKKVLLGELEPTGRLAETIPIKLTDTPSHLNWPGENHRVLYGEEIFVGYRGYDYAERDVAYPFGFGLGYTTFEYTSAKARVVYDPVREPSKHCDDDFENVIEVDVELSNTGSRTGTEVVQVYARFPHSSFRREVRSLVGFARIELAPGESRTVTIPIVQRNLCLWRDGWFLEGGEYTFDIGSSSRDIRFSTCAHLSGHDAGQVIVASSTLREWYEDQRAKEAIASVIGEDTFSELANDMLVLAGDQPLDRFARLMGDKLTISDIDEALKLLRNDQP